MILVNGFPKTGTHAGVRALELLGLPSDMQHVPHGELAGPVFMRRDPRDALLSRLRMDGQPLTAGMYMTRFRRYVEDSLPVDMGRYTGWLTDPSVHVVTYEALIASDAEMRRLAGLVGVRYQEGAFAHLDVVGSTLTHNVEKSDYRTIWNDDVQAVWDNEGGRELLKAWGYA